MVADPDPRPTTPTPWDAARRRSEPIFLLENFIHYISHFTTLKQRRSHDSIGIKGMFRQDEDDLRLQGREYGSAYRNRGREKLRRDRDYGREDWCDSASDIISVER